MMVMGVRLYNPAAGRFLQADAVDNGNANSYEYCAGDPNNCTDTSGYGSYCKRAWYGLSCGVIINLSSRPIRVMKDWYKPWTARWLWPRQSTGWGRDYDALMVLWPSHLWGVRIPVGRWIRVPNTPIWFPWIVW